jgi:hypothetical protein
VTTIEATISESLREATADLTAPANLPALAHAGGSRRLRRHRLASSVGVVAVAAAIVPVTMAIGNLGARHNTAPSAAIGSRLYANPPVAAHPCLQPGAPAAAAAYPQLLRLPAGQPVSYAFTNTGGAPQCAFFPHVAATLLHTSAGVVSRSVVIDGPNAMTAAQAGVVPSRFSSGTTAGAAYRQLHVEIDGHPALIVYAVHTRKADAFWPGADGSRWHAASSGLTPVALETLLNSATYDPHAGTATVDHQAVEGWSVQPAVPDSAVKHAGVFYALWHQDGGKVAMTVTPGPNRIDQLAESGSRLVTVNGQPAVVSAGGHGFTVLRWQAGTDVTVYLSMTHSSAQRLEGVAAGIDPINPDDPRLHRPQSPRHYLRRRTMATIRATTATTTACC